MPLTVCLSREEWKFGQQEDWRYTKMARENERWWCLVLSPPPPPHADCVVQLSFLTVGVAQQPMLIGVTCLPLFHALIVLVFQITLPAFSIHQSSLSWWWIDWVATLIAVAGLLLAYCADTQLYNYVQENKARAHRGEHTVPVLASGVWR